MKIDFTQLIQTARKENRANAVAAYSAALAAIQSAQGRATKPLTETEILKIVAKEVAQIEEEIAGLKAAGRSWVDLEVRREILADLLPKKVPESQYPKLISEALAHVQAESIRDLGKVLKFISAQYGLTVDNGKIAGMLKEILK